MLDRQLCAGDVESILAAWLFVVADRAVVKLQAVFSRALLIFMGDVSLSRRGRSTPHASAMVPYCAWNPVRCTVVYDMPLAVRALIRRLLQVLYAAVDAAGFVVFEGTSVGVVYLPGPSQSSL